MQPGSATFHRYIELVETKLTPNQRRRFAGQIDSFPEVSEDDESVQTLAGGSLRMHFGRHEAALLFVTNAKMIWAVESAKYGRVGVILLYSDVRKLEVKRSIAGRWFLRFTTKEGMGGDFILGWGAPALALARELERTGSQYFEPSEAVETEARSAEESSSEPLSATASPAQAAAPAATPAPHDPVPRPKGCTGWLGLIMGIALVVFLKDRCQEKAGARGSGPDLHVAWLFLKSTGEDNHPFPAEARRHIAKAREWVRKASRKTRLNARLLLHLGVDATGRYLQELSTGSFFGARDESPKKSSAFRWLKKSAAGKLGAEGIERGWVLAMQALLKNLTRENVEPGPLGEAYLAEWRSKILALTRE